VIYFADNLVVGAFVSAQAVTLFAIGGRLIDYHRQFTSAMAQTLMPVASGFGARGESSQLRRLLIQGTRVALIVAWPIEIVLFVRGATFIGLWIGEEYAGPSSAVLRILLLSNFFVACNSVSANICFGLGRHKPFALWQGGEAAANLLLSVLLVGQLGINGVAWGTTLPSLLTNGIVWPIYICRILEQRPWSYIWQAWLRTGMALLPFLAGTVYAEWYWEATSLLGFVAQVVVLLPLIPVGLVISFWGEARRQLADRAVLRRYLRA
jgi:O-antigen/teichoic acid export membrane protein